MLFRTAVIACLCAFTLSLAAQNNGATAGQEQCPAGTVCSNFHTPDSYPTLVTRPEKNRWQIDFKPTDASISCAVVKYDPAQLMPVLHLLCPGPDVFAPLRVHLTLTWKDVSEVPDSMRNILVDAASNSLVRFQSKPGESRVELNLHHAEETQSFKEWVNFTKINVGLVPSTQ